MPQPPTYAPAFDFEDYETSNPATPKPGAPLDGEFAALKATLDAVLANLALIQRDDGALANVSVGSEQLKPGIAEAIHDAVEAEFTVLVGQAQTARGEAWTAATSAASSATVAGVSAGNADTSASAAAASASAASGSASAASASQTAAANSASAAAGSASMATGKVAAANDHRIAAEGSASSASTSATSAANSASTAAGHATTASAQATAAGASASEAKSYRDQAASSASQAAASAATAVASASQVLPTPQAGDAGKVVTVKADLSGYELVSGGGGTDDQTAAEVPFTPAGNIEATNVQAAIQELDSEKSAAGHNHDGTYQPLDADLTALAQLAGTGIARRTGANTWTVGTAIATSEIADDAVTYAKMQNVSATDRLLGRSTAGTGNVEEIVCTAAARALLDDTTVAAQRATLGMAAVAISAFHESPANQDYVLVYKAPFAFNIDEIDVKTTSGTLTLAVKINTTAVTGMSALSVSSTNTNAAAAGANAVAVDDTVQITVSAGSSPVNLQLTIKGTRT